MAHRNIVILTGAGVSAESGVPTFRASDGLWEGHRIEEVATPEGFAADPQTVAQTPSDRHDEIGRVERELAVMQEEVRQALRSRSRAPWTDVRFLLGLLLVVVSIAGVWFVVAAARQTAPVFAATRTIVPGEVVAADDLQVVDIALGEVGDLRADGIEFDHVVRVCMKNSRAF